EYFSKSPGHRALIVLMGPLVNYILAYLCFCLVFVLGYPSITSKIGEVLKGYPADIAGLKANDKILRIGPKEILSWEDVQQYISTSKEPTLNFVILRNNQPVNLNITPRK